MSRLRAMRFGGAGSAFALRASAGRPLVLDDPNRALCRAIAQAIGKPSGRASAEDGHAAVDSAALATVDEFLKRIHRLKEALSDRDAAASGDSVAVRLILSDLALAVRLLRALNSDAAERLDSAANDLEQARNAMSRSLIATADGT